MSLYVSHAEVPTSRKAQGDTHLIFNDLKVLIKAHNSKFHCVDIKKNIVKQHVLAQTCFSFSMLQYSCLSASEILRSFPKQPSSASPTPEGFVWEAYTQLCAAETHCLSLERLQSWGEQWGCLYWGLSALHSYCEDCGDSVILQLGTDTLDFTQILTSLQGCPVSWRVLAFPLGLTGDMIPKQHPGAGNLVQHTLEVNMLTQTVPRNTG